jgi:Bacterial Ig domain/Gametolysin peptidase M11
MGKTRSAPRRAAGAWTCAAVLMLGPGLASASHIGEDLQADQQTVASSDQLLGALRQYERALPGQQAAQLQRLTQLAAARRERMLMLVERNPKLAALRVMPAAVRERLPSAVRAFVEQPVAFSGSVVASISDDFVNGRSTKHIEAVDAAGQRFELRVADASERELLALVGKRGTITAMQLDKHLLVLDKRSLKLAADGTQTTASAAVTGSAAAVQGDQSTLVVMLNFNDKAITCTAADVQSRLFGSSGSTLTAGYQQSSGNLVSFSGQVIGPYTINHSSTGACDSSGWASAANAAAIAAGFNPANYKRVSYTMPANATCGWSGLATLGGTSPTPSWIQSCGSTGVFSHELGHNLKFHHASTPTSEYGDSSDPMGGGLLVQSNAANRVMAGWVSGSQLQDVGNSGSYAIQPLENMASTSPLVLRLPKPDSAETYYVSLREGQDLDAGLPSGYKGALSVHRASGTLPAQTFRVANLAAGQSWTDSINGITVTHQGLTATGASVGVTVGGAACTRAAPAVSVAPASQSAAPGTSLAYALNVTNNNSAGCPSSTFNMTQALPVGFGGSFSAPSVVLGAGASANIGWTVASPASSGDATYTLTASASEASVSNSADAHGTFTVLAPVAPPPPPPPPPPAADTTPPTLVITSPSANAALSGRTISLGATATDATGVAAVEFYVDGKLLATDSGAPYAANWNLRKAAKGSHSIRVRALDTAGNAAEQVITVTVN